MWSGSRWWPFECPGLLTAVRTGLLSTVPSHMRTDRPDGADFYDSADRVDRYLQHRYNSERSPNISIEEPAVLASVGDLRNTDIVDLGCGDGSFGSIAIDAGCRSYRGIDRSAAMIERARLRLAHTGAKLEQATIEAVPLRSASADLVLSRMALHYVSDIEPVLGKIHDSLRPGGRVVLTVVHPVITSHDSGNGEPRQHWVVDDYFLDGPRTRMWFGEPVVWHHRTIEQYLNALQRAGLMLTRLSECEPTPARFAANRDELARRQRVPLFLLLEGHRPTA